MNTSNTYSLGIIGVRGYVGKELLKLIDAHPHIETHWVSSRQLEGQSIESLYTHEVDDVVKNDAKNTPLTIECLSPDDVANRNTDIIVLALPNGLAVPFVEAIEARTMENIQKETIIIDLSADYRFEQNNESNPWIYSVPELDEEQLKQARNSSNLIKISNPGCYATAMQLALAPIIEQLSSTPHCFGVSGYSGAGTKPSPNNDPNNLEDNLIGYALSNHLHEREVSHRLKSPVYFSPHVAAFFRGINMTIHVRFNQPQNQTLLLEHFNDFYQKHPLVIIQDSIPVVKQVVLQPTCVIGGFSVHENEHNVSFVSCLDNLAKGAASQALQNINIALGFTSELTISSGVKS